MLKLFKYAELFVRITHPNRALETHITEGLDDSDLSLSCRATLIAVDRKLEGAVQVKRPEVMRAGLDGDMQGRVVESFTPELIDVLSQDRTGDEPPSSLGRGQRDNAKW